MANLDNETIRSLKDKNFHLVLLLLGTVMLLIAMILVLSICSHERTTDNYIHGYCEALGYDNGLAVNEDSYPHEKIDCYHEVEEQEEGYIPKGKIFVLAGVEE